MFWEMFYKIFMKIEAGRRQKKGRPKAGGPSYLSNINYTYVIIYCT